MPYKIKLDGKSRTLGDFPALSLMTLPGPGEAPDTEVYNGHGERALDGLVSKGLAEKLQTGTWQMPMGNGTSREAPTYGYRLTAKGSQLGTQLRQVHSCELHASQWSSREGKWKQCNVCSKVYDDTREGQS